MSPAGKFALSLAIFCAVSAYLAVDFFIFKGPFHQIIRRGGPAESELAARVVGHPITHSQLERAVGEHLWLQGLSTTSATPSAREVARKAALDELIDHVLLRLQVKASPALLTVTDEEIHERLRRLVGRFESKGALETAMKSQGIATEADLRARLAARIRQEKFIESRIRPAIQVTDAEARQWFEENPTSVSLPDRVKARHLFRPTLDQAPEEAKLKLDTALADLTTKKKDFPTLAKEISEDPATKDNGGELGWMTRDRLPEDFGTPIFSLPVNQPSLLRTRLGWHLVEITERRLSEPRTFEQARPEIIAALEATKRREATEDFRKSLRRAEAARIEIFAPADSP
jgi:parvulin-like peptidyl-prolyl isomerase